MSKNDFTTTNQKQAFDDLNYIKHLTTKTRNSAAEASPYFIIWGTIWIIGYGAEAIGYGAILHWIWSALGALGMMLTFYTSFRQSQRSPLPKVVEQQLQRGFIGFSIVASLVIILIVTDFLQFQPEYVGLYAIIVTAVMYMFIGIALGKEIFLMGCWFAILAAGNALFFPPYHPALTAIIGGGSILFTGWVLRQWSQKNDR
ncbi:hypothetical protein SAMN04488134_102275 [Amphibacillus marinus]|uniref:Uncharacterized protein n=1 Tax=Amphibacillus marinus TaxID=872970 RepID=A0A1H8KG61_9BACI|nr:hypothetical protein [Amphibacillus marinus]SEN91701.1 hypothetical protein SAMN04488134_102275 [Amphibacillus marinus]